MEGSRLSDFDFRSNSIGFLRLFFALIVVWSHTFQIGGFGYDPVLTFSRGAGNAGTFAVAGFFVLSGFLITRSYEHVAGWPRFLWHRILRIFPGYWVCLFVTAFVMAPLAFLHQHGSLAGFWAQVPAPVTYVWWNADLLVRQEVIGTLLSAAPETNTINGSLWTLRPEFVCYLAVAALGLGAVLRRMPLAVFAASIAMWMVYFFPIAVGGHRELGITRFSELFAYFLFGSSAYLLRSVLPMRPLAAVACIVAAVLSLPTNYYAFVVPPCLSYAVLYAAMNWGPRSFDRKIDLSYGVYIYAFPLQQLFVVYGLNLRGFGLTFALTTAATVVFAGASWFLIERPSLTLKNLSTVGQSSRRVARRIATNPTTTGSTQLSVE